ncbi:MAG: 5-formyltetrahydrofolate cyclo-ligase [Thermoprotei archaeon]|nr:MAG: 5-formyltetrahydrofolate cyclo-ligase [Thermoprotei archaeon]
MSNTGDVNRIKNRIRRQVWEKMEKLEIATSPRPCYGKIPNFIGSLNASNKIVKLDMFRKARVIYSTIDLPQKPIREETLRRDKILITSMPKVRGFIILDPSRIDKRMISYATTVRGSLRMGERIRILEDIRIDLVVLGSVAVTRNGARLGKGDGQYDLEYALLRELHVIDENTPVVTTVHDVQIVDDIPMLRHDVPADIVATPSQLIFTKTPYRKPSGIYWEMLSIEEIKSNPILRQLFGITYERIR